ncbi:MAG: hypothetical protein O2782_13685 [bacterium]|nr:hypothetical protein [bacterium]
MACPTPEQIETFERDGYQIVAEALPAPRVAELLGVVARLDEDVPLKPWYTERFGAAVRD